MNTAVRLAMVGALAAGGLVPALWADDDLAQGKILVADRKLKDPSFEKAVVYLITYDDQGAVGLILNRETDTPVTKILSGVKEAANRKDFAFQGGPVEPSSVMALYRTAASTGRRQGTRQVGRDVVALLDEAALRRALAAGADSSALRFYTGYAGWGPGQLENEVDVGAWTVLSGDSKTVFDSTPETLWDRLDRRKDERVVRAVAPHQYRLLTRAAQ
jgi:putative transcriptional regulator